MWGIYIYVWNNTWHTIVQSTVSRETFEGENFHKLVKNRFSRRKLSRIARFCQAKGPHGPKFRGENFCEMPHNHEIREGFLPRKFPAIWYTPGNSVPCIVSETTSTWLFVMIYWKLLSNQSIDLNNMKRNGWRSEWQWVARGDIQQISYIPQKEQHSPCRELFFYIICFSCAIPHLTSAVTCLSNN